MNARQAVEAYEAGELAKGDSVTITGQIRMVWEPSSGETDYGPWSFSPVLFGDETDAVRISFKNAPHDIDFEEMKGQELKFKSTVDIYTSKKTGEKGFSLLVDNVARQLNTSESAPTQGDDEITPAKDNVVPFAKPSKPNGQKTLAGVIEALKVIKGAVLEAALADSEEDVRAYTIHISIMHERKPLDLVTGPSAEDIPF